MKAFRTLAVSAALLAFLLAVLGSWVRINGAGMTCPDWPLCRGALVPRLEGGVVLEWSHRFVASLEGIVMLAAVSVAWRMRRRVAGVEPVVFALIGIFIVQVALGGVTVRLSNRPDSVVLHWGAAMALLADLTILAVLSLVAPATPPRIDRRAALFICVSVSAFCAMCAGAYVSSSGAGLSCSTLPGCESALPFGASPAQYAQMLHRSLAALLMVLAVGSLFCLRGAGRRTKSAVVLGVGLLAVQVVLGVANVVWALPMPLREAHAANAVVLFLTFVVASVYAALDAERRAALPSSLRGARRPTARRLRGATE